MGKRDRKQRHFTTWKGSGYIEIKINKEIRQYQENIFFGFSLRQFSCALCAVGLSIGVHLLLKNYAGQESISWLCIAAAAPVAVLGFFQYNGMNAEQFLCALVKSKLLCAGKRVFKAENYLYIATRKKGEKHID